MVGRQVSRYTRLPWVNGKLADHILSTPKRQRTGSGANLSNLIASVSFLNSTANQGQNIQTHEPMGDNSHQTATMA